MGGGKGQGGQRALTPLRLTEHEKHRFVPGLLLLRAFCARAGRSWAACAEGCSALLRWELQLGAAPGGVSGFPGSGTCPLLMHGMRCLSGH